MQLSVGQVYMVTSKNSKPPHRWIILSDTDQNGQALSASLTDRHTAHTNYPDIWPVGYGLLDNWACTKESIIALAYADLIDADWLFDRNAQLIGECLPDALARARCSFCYTPDELKPAPRHAFEWAADDWCPDCPEPVS